jgi:hypothetical protein
MRSLQLLFALGATVGLLAACSYHKIEAEDGRGHFHHDGEVEIEYDD